MYSNIGYSCHETVPLRALKLRSGISRVGLQHSLRTHWRTPPLQAAPAIALFLWMARCQGAGCSTCQFVPRISILILCGHTCVTSKFSSSIVCYVRNSPSLTTFTRRSKFWATVLAGVLNQRYLYTLDRRRGGLACPAGWRGFCRLGGKGSWHISKLLLYRQSGRAPLRNTTASVTTEATALSCSCQSIYIYNVLGHTDKKMLQRGCIFHKL